MRPMEDIWASAPCAWPQLAREHMCTNFRLSPIIISWEIAKYSPKLVIHKHHWNETTFSHLLPCIAQVLNGRKYWNFLWYVSADVIIMSGSFLCSKRICTQPLYDNKIGLRLANCGAGPTPKRSHASPINNLEPQRPGFTRRLGKVIF